MECFGLKDMVRADSPGLAGCGRVCPAAVPLPPSGFLLLLPPWEEVQLIGCRRRRVALIPPDSDSNTWRGGATRTQQQPTMASDIREVSGESGLDLLSAAAAAAVWFVRFDPNKNAEAHIPLKSQMSFNFW